MTASVGGAHKAATYSDRWQNVNTVPLLDLGGTTLGDGNGDPSTGTDWSAVEPIDRNLSYPLIKT
jgi:hypothetical protein